MNHEQNQVELYPVWIRVWHWINALSFVMLIVSGLSLHFAGSSMPLIGFNNARILHNIFGILLSINCVIYLLATLTGNNAKHYKPQWKGLINRLNRQALFYGIGIFRDEPHPFPATIHCKFNPLQQMTYLGVMFIAMPLLILSGVLFFFPEVAPERFLGFDGVWLVGVSHYLIGLFLTTFMIGHIYLATAGETLFGEFKKMIVGSKCSEEKP